MEAEVWLNQFTLSYRAKSHLYAHRQIKLKYSQTILKNKELIGTTFCDLWNTQPGDKNYQFFLTFSLWDYKYFCHLLRSLPHQDGMPFNKHMLKLKSRLLFSSVCATWLLWARAIRDFCGLFLEENTEEWHNHGLLLWNNSHWLIPGPCGNYRWAAEGRVYGHIKQRQPDPAWQ